MIRDASIKNEPKWREINGQRYLVIDDEMDLWAYLMFTKMDPADFNENIIIGDLVDCTGLLEGCTNFNSYVIFRTKYVKTCAQMFRGCVNFNKSIDIPRVTYENGYDMMFYGCERFDQEIKIPDGVRTSCEYMFYGCKLLNSPVTIGDEITNCRGMFAHCYSFDQPISIPSTVYFS